MRAATNAWPEAPTGSNMYAGHVQCALLQAADTTRGCTRMQLPVLRLTLLLVLLYSCMQHWCARHLSQMRGAWHYSFSPAMLQVPDM
jgi:hypothetical protein